MLTHDKPLSPSLQWLTHGPRIRYIKLRVAHAPGMPGLLSPPQRLSDPGMHQGTCVTHVPECMPGSLTRSFIWSRWREKRSRHSRRMRNPHFYLSGKRSIDAWWCIHALVGENLLPEPMLSYWQMNLGKEPVWNSNRNADIFVQNNVFWKCSLQSVGHSVQAIVC